MEKIYHRFINVLITSNNTQNGQNRPRISYTKRRGVSRIEGKSSMRLLIATFAVLLAGASGIFLFTKFAKAATYNFVQSAWTGGVTANTALHASNQTGWNQYSAATTVTAAATVTLSPTAYTFTEDGATSTTPTIAAAGGGGFSNGINSSTAVSGSGTGASVALSRTDVTSSKIVGGYYNGLILKMDGTVWGMGYNYTGAIGDGTTFSRNYAVQTHGPLNTGYLSGVTEIASGAANSYALRSDGTVWAWGAPGKIGDNTNLERLFPVQVVGTGGSGYLTSIVSISANSGSALAVKSDGTVWSWGANTYGQLGDSTTVARLAPVQVHGTGNSGFLTGVTAVAMGQNTAYALKSDGTVWSWGANSSGEIGDSTFLIKTTPVQVVGVGGTGFLTGVTAIAAGKSNGYALKSDGTVVAWGAGATYALGNGTQSNVAAPVAVSTLTNVTEIASSGSAAYALKSDGTAWAWGTGDNGEIGNASGGSSLTPVQVHGPGNVGFLTGVTGIGAGLFSGYAIKSDGTVWSWGYNGDVQLGSNTLFADRVYPVQVKTDSLQNLNAGIGGVTSFKANIAYNASVLKSDGSVWIWGPGGFGALGISNYASGAGGGQTPSMDTPVNVSSLTAGITSIALYGIANLYGGGYALKSDGTVWSWGSGAFSQIGDNTNSDRVVPVQVHGPGNIGFLTGITAIAAGERSGYALKSDGTVWGWGTNSMNELGDGTAIARLTPVQVSGLTSITAIASNGYGGYALKSDGTVWSWGSNNSGGLGDNTTINRATPVQVVGVGGTGFLTGVTAIAASKGQTTGYALRSDGTVVAWGYGVQGQLGNGSITSSSFPVQVSSLTNVTSVAGGYFAGYAIKSDGTAWAWGQNDFFQLGDNTLTNRSTPVQVSGLAGVVSIEGGYKSAYAIKNDGTVWSWGYNINQQLGRHVPDIWTINGCNDGEGYVYDCNLAVSVRTPGMVQDWVLPVTNLSAGTPSYSVSGTFTSAVIDLGTGMGSPTLLYTGYAPVNTTLTGDIRTSDDNVTWSSWTNGVVDVSIHENTPRQYSSDITAYADGKRYIQYRLNYTTADTSVTPRFDELLINFNQFAASGDLTSSKYDSGDATNVISRLTWTATGTTTTETIKFQMRSSADGVTWTNWCGPSVTCDGTDYFLDANNGVALALNHPLKIGGNDRYLEYKAFLASGGGATPTLTSVTPQYVVNAAPGFDATYGTNGVTVSQISNSADANWGKVTIGYSVRDIDATTGSNTANYVTPSFEYSTDGGSSWAAVPSGDLVASDITNKLVNEVTYTTYTATWNAPATIASTYTATAKIRVTVNDNEGANNTTQAISGAFTLDTKAPTLSAGHATLDSSTGASSATLTITASDDSQLQYRACNDNTFPTTDAKGNSCAWSVLGATIASTTAAWTPTGSAGPESVYVQIRDALGNVTPQTVVAPAMPTNFDYKDVSNTAVNAYWEFVSWGVFVNTTGSTFAGYKLYTSTDGSNYSLLTTITDPAINYYRDNIVTATSSAHYYKILAVDTDGDLSHFTAAVSDIPNGQGSLDSTAPTVSAIVVPGANLKNTSANVTFTTDELAQGTIQYRVSGAQSWTTVTSSSYGLAQSMYITGLTPNTTYNLQVKATDVVGNASVYTAGPDFTTAGGPVISGVTVINLNDVSATIFWNTDRAADSYVYSSVNASLANPSLAGSATLVDCVASVCQHQVLISGLTAGRQYYYYVKSTDALANESTDTNSGAYYTFTTTLDTVPPVISAISTPVMASNEAVVVWQTNELATGQVLYGTTSGDYSKFSAIDYTKSIYHVVTLSPETTNAGIAGGTNTLLPETQYYYIVKSNDVAGNLATSPEQTFTTPSTGNITIIVSTVNRVVNGTGAGEGPVVAPPDTTAPVISNIVVSNIDSFGATITYNTDEDAVSFVDYGKDTSYGYNIGDPVLQRTHTIKLHSLTMGTNYHVRVKAIDKSGNIAISDDQMFQTKFLSEQTSTSSVPLDDTTLLQNRIDDLIQSTLPSLAPPFISKPVISDITQHGATITWTTNVKSYGLLNYATDDEFITKPDTYTLSVSSGSDRTTTHSVTLTNLKANTTYHIQASGYVFQQVIGKSGDLTFVTKAAEIVGSITNRSKDSFTVAWTTEEPTTSIVEYKDIVSGRIDRSIDQPMRTAHSVRVENLPSGTTYEVGISGVNAKGNTIEALAPITVTTSRDITPPLISGFKVDGTLVPGRTDRIQTVVSWKTDEPSDSTVYYEEGAGTLGSRVELANKVSAGGNPTTVHSVILANLKPGTIYRIKITSTDDSGNKASFGPRTIITPQQTQSITDIIFKNFEDSFKFLRQI